MRISLIIPALNEALCLAPLLAEVPSDLVHEIIVVDNGSTDKTAAVARAAGAYVVSEPRRGYGFACAAGVAAASGDVLAFMDGDGSFVPGELTRLLAPLLTGEADVVLGTRMRGGMIPGSMPRHQLGGNRLVAALLHLRYGIQLSDLGPFRVITRRLLMSLAMREQTYGWPIEMMIKAIRAGARLVEIPVTYRPRTAGRSKVGGTIRGTVLTAYRIFSIILRYSLD